jgi:carbon-monoxide dehydrogenase medium subunit
MATRRSDVKDYRAMTLPFILHRPRVVEEASQLLEEFGDDAAVFCGGTELLLVMKMGLASFDHLIDLKAIPELHGIQVEADGGLRIGAAVTHREIERSPVIAQHLPSLAELEKHVANIRVRNSGSLGGNLCFAEPHSDPATLLIAADAVLLLSGPAGTRDVPLANFILGPLLTTREADEVLVSVSIPRVAANTFFAYRKIAFRERPVASVAARISVDDGRIQSAAIVVGSVGERPTTITEAASRLDGAAVADASAAIDAAAAAAGEGSDPAADLNGSEDYQRHLVTVLTRRALDSATQQARAWAQ